jgi:uncharacterized membrane protein YbhN (UPF0104 family)
VTRGWENPTPSDQTAAAGARSWWRWIRLLGGAVVLAVVVLRLGAEPFLDGLRAVDLATLALAAGIGLLTTVCCAWRWSLVARGLGIGLPLGAAVAAYYRSQFLNTTLPGGMLGDVHRAVRHGRDVDDVGRGLRAVAWERTAGLVAFVEVTVIVLITVPSPLQSWILPAGTLLGVAVAAAILLRTRSPHGSRRWTRIVAAAADDIRNGLLARSVWPKILLASAVVVAGHTATFVIAARATGAAATPIQLLPIAVLVLLAMVVPLGVGGWGPREGMAAWAFAAVGLGAAQGVAAATLYGVLTLAAALPGAAVLIVGIVDRRAGRVRPPTRSSGTVSADGIAHG